MKSIATTVNVAGAVSNCRAVTVTSTDWRSNTRKPIANSRDLCVFVNKSDEVNVREKRKECEV